MAEIRGLSVRQPWAWAITYGGKTVDNRTRAANFRGLLAIHANKSLPRAEDVNNPVILDAIADRGFEIDEAASRRGVIVAVAELAGCHRDEETAVQRSGMPPCSPWAQRNRWHWVLSGVRPLPEPVPCRGALGLWRLPEDVEEAVRAQLEVTPS